MLGVDAKIESLRELIAAKFAAFSTFTAYGRAYTNEREDGGKVPEVKTTGTSEYNDVLIDTRKDGLCFFIVENNVEGISDIDLTAVVSIYFAVNLDKLYSTVTERAVEYLHRDVIQQINDAEFDFDFFTSGLEAFSEFDITKPTDNMQPYYLVKFQATVEYQINENYNC